MRKATVEERMLGLDPNKYTEKPWNPNMYIGNPPKQDPMATIASELRSSQEALLGREEPVVSEIDRDQIKKEMMRRLGGQVTETELEALDALEDAGPQRPDPSLFAPNEVEAIRQLGWTKFEDGIPLIGKEDEDLLNRSINTPEHLLTPRERLIIEAMTDRFRTEERRK